MTESTSPPVPAPDDGTDGGGGGVTTTATTTMPTLIPGRVPPRVRQPVLGEPADEVAARLRAHPGEWDVIASGPKSRLGVISQTAYRIRTGQIKAFAVGTGRGGGRFEATVSTAANAEDRQDAVDLWARWVAR